MSKILKPATKKEIVEIERLLRNGRSRYDNELLKIEKMWAKLKPHDYDRRASLIKAATGMLKIDQELKVWEDKLNAES
jgi:hypothetical protein